MALLVGLASASPAQSTILRLPKTAKGPSQQLIKSYEQHWTAYQKGGNHRCSRCRSTCFGCEVNGYNLVTGGGCFYPDTADGRLKAIDGAEMAPAAAHRDMYLRDGAVDASPE